MQVEDITNLPPDQRRMFAIAATTSLPAADQEEIVRAVVGSPTQSVTDIIWITIVTGFVAALVGTFFALAATYVTTGANGPTLLTIFTTVAGFLAGLLAPSPVGRGR